ncbi:unnamed protein product [Dracunculus medinensis]|uniref:Calponin-homology (CH) domain-containing protein n=1 Tax=Dracunculus medinensis TaxID=318479 RepID=A0A0N4UPP3_DRAME|nr:unnamed protein product [Dracunculus medinensis]
MADGQREENLFEKDEELMHSKPTSTSTTPKSTPKTTPKLNLKFAKQAQEGKVFDFGKSKFTSKHEVVRKGKDVDVKLESLKLAKEDQLRFVILPPNKANLEQLEIEPKIKKSRHNYEISFRPTEVGTHKVMVYVNDVLHPQCPFPIRVYDASEIIVGEIAPQSTINDTVEFTVDAGRAGFGNLEMAIKDSDGVIIPSHVAQLESGTAKFLVTFNPTSVGMHTVNITFNKEVLKNSPFEVNIVEAKPIVTDSGIIDDKKKEKKQKEERKREEKEKQKKEREEKQLAETLKKNREKELKKKKHILDRKPSLSKIPSLSRVNKSAQIVVSVYDDSPLEVSVKDPSKNLIDYSISDHESGGKKVEFIPVKVDIKGDHEVDIKCGGIDVQGSPFTCRAYDPAKIGVGNIPNGIVEQAVHFIVDASEAGVGNLEVAVNEGRVPSMAQSLGQHRYDISFIPREKVDHTISVRFNNEPVPGSPFICHLVSTHSISASGPGLERVPVGQTSEFFVLIEGDQSDIPSVRITDSQGNNIPVRVDKDNAADSRFIINYTPQIVGNHQIEIEHAGKPVHGSPFTSKAFDAKCARLSRVDAAYVGRPCTFTIDAARAGAGNMEIIVSVDNRNVPNFVQAEGQAKFKVSFTPQEAKDHVISVRFNGEPIPGSPMVCPVSEVSQSVAAVVPLSSGPDIAQQARLVGDISSAQVGNVKGFTVDTGGRDADCNVIVIDPIGNEVCVQMERVSTGYLAQENKNDEIYSGTYGVRIEIDGKEMNSSPFVIEVTGQPKISRIPSVVFIGKEMAFNAETDLANRRNINIEIRGEDGRTIPVRTSVDNTGIKASCKFRNVGRYSVNITLNGKLIESKTIEVVEPGVGVSLVNDIDQGFVGQAYKVLLRIDNNSLKKLVAVAVTGNWETRIAINRPITDFKWLIFNWNYWSSMNLNTSVNVLFFTDQERNPVSVSLKKISDDIFEAEFTPLFEGTHKIAVTIDERHIRGSPFTVTILDLSAVRIIGLKNDAVGVEQRFNVDWSNSGGSEASVRVTKDNSEVPCTVKKIKQGLHVCSFTPNQVGLYLIDVYVDGTLLPECPYECIVNDMGAVRARGDALTRAQRGKIARFEVSVGNNTRRELDVLVRDSHGSPLPVRCYKQHDDSYWVEFTPENIGSHKIEVTFGDVPIAGSPFHCEVVDPRKVFIRGNTEPLILRQQAVLTVERENAGNGELKVEIVDPTGQPLKIEKTKSPNGEERIIFLPTRLGQHKLTAKLSGFVVNGSPQMLVVEEQGEPSLYGDALNRPAEVEQPVILIFDSKKQKGALKVDIRGPDRSKARFATNKRSDGNVEIIFNPSEVGQYMVNAEMNNKPIAGSPFDVSVVDARKVLINDELADDKGTFHFPIQQNNIIDVDATAAGPGKLRAEVRDGSGKVMDAAEVESLGYGKYRIIFNPQIAGKFNIYLYWADIAVESAFPIHIIAETEQPSTSRVMPLSDEIDHRSRSRSSERYEDGQDDHQRIIARGDGLTKAIVKEQSEFIIDGSDSNQDGHISCSLIGQKADVPVRLIHLGNNVYKASYTPLISGKYELQIMWNGRQIRGSPFKVNVDSHTSAAELINVDTSTLKFGVINEDIKTVINTRKAPPGQLSAQCMGPSKLAYCELYDHRDGTYTLSVKPSEIGKHTLVIKYSDEHVPGSPFIVNVSHAPDASKVRVYGPGIEHGILSTFKSNFVVETKGAGAGQLTVRVRGPKGAFNVEMQREKKQERTIHCKYEPKEPGDYQVEVKWHGEHVPGSPFLVMIVDTEQELQRFLRGDAPSPQPATPFIPPGWVGTPPPPPPLFLSGAGIRPPFPHHPSFSPPHPHHGPILPYAPLPPPPMRAGVRPKYASGY